MMNVETVRSNLNTINLLNERSQVRAVQAVREKIEKSVDPLGTANSIITMFGCKPIDNNQAALIKAQAVILAAQKAAIAGTSVDENELDAIGESKVKDIMSNVTTATATETTKPRSKKGAKRERAVELYKANADKPIKTIAVTIADEMNVSLANAYTYVYNVRKMLGLETSPRGRKPKTVAQN